MGILRTFATCVLGICMFALPLASASAQPVTPSSQPAEIKQEAPAPDYVLGPEDVVEVDVLGRPDFKTRARIGADGTIQLPLIGRIDATDRTARVLGEDIRKALQSGGFFANPIVNVDVASYASRYVTVLGAVGSPGLIPVNRSYRLSEILARVGGVKDNGADYLVIRSVAGDERRVMVKEIATGDASQDPFVLPGDKIFSPVADLFYISGQVNSPGAYPLSSDLTLQMAIARAGGLTPSGSDKGVQVTRKGTKTKLDLSSKVEAGDVVVVKERFF